MRKALVVVWVLALVGVVAAIVATGFIEDKPLVKRDLWIVSGALAAYSVIAIFVFRRLTRG